MKITNAPRPSSVLLATLRPAPSTTISITDELFENRYRSVETDPEFAWQVGGV